MSVNLADRKQKPGKPKDFYREFLDDSRWLTAEQAAARQTWFEKLALKNKSTALFEFEMMLKGFVCFCNPVNQPGPRLRPEPARDRDFKAEFQVAVAIARRVVKTGRKLIDDKPDTPLYKRYFDSVINQDERRFQTAKQRAALQTPEQSIGMLVVAFENLLEIIEGLSALDRVSFQLYTSVVEAAVREIENSRYFNPLAALEFRAEYDGVYPEDLLAMIHHVESVPARKVAALTFLALFRILRYLSAIKHVCERKVSYGALFGWLSVLRSDIRALTVFLRRDAAAWIAGGFGRLYESETSERVSYKYDTLKNEFKSLKSLRKLLISVGDQLRLEQRKVFEQQLPAFSAIQDLENFAELTRMTIIPLSAFVQNALLLLALDFEPSLRGTQIFTDFISLKEQSERLRRDIWMFQQILRAFIEKAESSAIAADQWAGKNTFQFVREFVTYFRSMGYQLLRWADYEQFDRFLGLVDRLQEGDVLEVQRVEHVVAACRDFQTFLATTFDAVSDRQELRDKPFNRKEAAETLKLFLSR